MEEEEVLDPHQRSALADAAEEAVDDACGKVGLEAGRSGRPGTGAHHDGLEEKGHREAAKEVGQCHNEKPAGANREDISDHGLLDGILRHVPLTAPVSGECLGVRGATDWA